MVVVSDRKSHISITAQHKSQCSLHDSRRARSAAPPRDNLVICHNIIYPQLHKFSVYHVPTCFCSEDHISESAETTFFVEPKAIYVHKVVRAPDIKIYIKVAGLFSIILSLNHRGLRQIYS